jgi:DNA-binding Lrp family transcriptional regulator
MSKSSKDKIDKDKELILEELQKNANKSVNEIANKIGFSRQKVWRIIKDLENNNIIWGYTAVTNFNKLDLKYFIILAKRSHKPMDKQMLEKVTSRTLEEQLEQLGGKLISSMYVNGVYDWIISFTCKDLIEAKKVTELLHRLYSDYLKKIDLLQGLFPCKLHNIQNPDIENLSKLFNL